METRVPAWLGSDEGLLPGCLLVTCSGGGESEQALISFSSEDITPSWGSHPHNLF